MSHVQELYRQEALGLISSREFDRRFDDAVEQDLIDSRAERDLDAEYEAYCAQEYEAYIQDMLNSMTPHERKHAQHPNRIDLKGGHRHNHVRNARLRGNVCPLCDGIIAKGCGERRYDGVLFCTECAQADYEGRCDRAEYLSHIYG